MAMTQENNVKILNVKFNDESHFNSIVNFINNASHRWADVGIITENRRQKTLLLQFGQANLFNEKDLFGNASLSGANVDMYEIQGTPIVVPSNLALTGD